MTERTTMEPMTETEIQSLKAKAEQATPGPWAYEAVSDNNEWCLGVVVDENDKPLSGEVEHGQGMIDHCIVREAIGLSDAAYIAACSPDAILRLLALVEQPTILDRAIAAIEDLQVNYIGIRAHVHRGDAIEALRALQPPPREASANE